MKKVGIVMGSDSDLPILRKTMDTLASLDIPFECHVYSAHRTPEEANPAPAHSIFPSEGVFEVLCCLYKSRSPNGTGSF